MLLFQLKGNKKYKDLLVFDAQVLIEQVKVQS
jgi:hypothetical protein